MLQLQERETNRERKRKRKRKEKRKKEERKRKRKKERIKKNRKKGTGISRHPSKKFIAYRILSFIIDSDLNGYALVKFKTRLLLIEISF